MQSMCPCHHLIWNISLTTFSLFLSHSLSLSISLSCFISDGHFALNVRHRAFFHGPYGSEYQHIGESCCLDFLFFHPSEEIASFERDTTLVVSQRRVLLVDQWRKFLCFNPFSLSLFFLLTNKLIKAQIHCFSVKYTDIDFNILLMLFATVGQFIITAS